LWIPLVKHRQGFLSADAHGSLKIARVLVRFDHVAKTAT
jgi:hypothetical protein